MVTGVDERMRMKKSIMAVLLVSLMCLLCACGVQQSQEQTEPPKVYYKVDFMLDGRVIAGQQVEAGKIPTMPTVEIPGLSFEGWMDETGAAVDVQTVAINADTVFQAIAYPELQAHTPFLFADEWNFLRPNAALTANELKLALETMAVEEAQMFLPTLPAGEEAVTPQQLAMVLTQFFSKERVEKAVQATGETVSRGQFAVTMCALLESAAGEMVKLSEGQVAPVDVHAEMAEYVALLEASVAHMEDATGVVWESAQLSTGYEPGFINRDGWLYYIQDSGHVLIDGNVGVLQFGPDGRYSCGDAELDAIVADVLNTIFMENPELDRFEILRKAFDYTRDSFTYLRKDPYEMGATGWEIADGKKMFQDTRGNCYYFAGAFWALARGLGYEAEAVSGTCTGTHQPHAWVIIEFDGEDYFFDPQWANNYLTREIYDHDMFMISMDRIWYWTYDWVR